ncbi:MAG TPA: MBL fold metallo-hydrolase [Gaiellaceae bacterium]|nr:MBL fold metallo-hydrolase [Gaiellaceae bacterium]
MPLLARIWGCRGSLPTPGPDTVRYGGNTSCVEVTDGAGSRVVLDAGTGIKRLGEALPADGAVHLLLTHLHLDHVEGLRFFEPLWRPEAELHIWGPPSPIHSLRERISRAVSPPLFPLELADSPARLLFHDVPREPWEIGGLRLFALPVSHPGPTLGFRVEAGGRSLAYIPDHEPVLGVELDALEPEWISGYAVAAGADVLLHDCQFDEEEYEARVGWGHSSVAHAVAFARTAGVGRLVLFHHDPGRGDEAVDALTRRAGELWGGAGGEPPAAAGEGMTLELA